MMEEKIEIGIFKDKERLNEIYFDAQYYLKEFYEKLGFMIRGRPFEEAGIKHIKMKMDLK